MSEARKIWIVWNEAMTQGIALTDQDQVKDIHCGIVTSGDLTEAMIDLHGGEVLTIDEVLLGVKI